MPYTKQGIGYQNRDTSLEAATSNVSAKVSLRDRVLAVIRESETPISADDIAEQLDKSFISIRPRVTELAGDLYIKDSGHRGKTTFGKSCILWEAVPDNVRDIAIKFLEEEEKKNASRDTR
tara:strand:- start:786 stop:1148 length:363 start_codon:yes stop_codon:yes gene_type:complete